MTLDALVTTCQEALQRQEDRPERFDGTVSLVLDRPWITQRRMKLLPIKGAPYGKPLSGYGGDTVVIFQATDILAFLESRLVKEGTWQ